MDEGSLVRRRTVGAFVAGLSLAVVGSFAAHTFTAGATGEESSQSSLVAVTPCRLADTRPEYGIGPNSTFGPNDTKTVQSTGTNGECTIPNTAVGLSLNVTAVNATLPTFLTIWPDGSMPNASSLNPMPGTVTPNAVTVRLATDGSFRIYNLQGNVDVIVDVNGYFVPAAPAALTASNHAGDTSIAVFPAPPTVLVSATLAAPGDGKVTVTAGAHLYNMGQPVDSVQCTISADAQYDVEFGIYPDGSFSSTRVFDVEAGEDNTFSLVCQTAQDGNGAFNNFISAIYTPAA